MADIVVKNEHTKGKEIENEEEDKESSFIEWNNVVANNNNCSIQSKPRDIDNILSEIGLGRFHLTTFMILGFCCITFSYNAVLSYFIANDPPWKCVSNTTSLFCQEHFGEKIGSDNTLFASRCLLRRDEWTYTTEKKYSFVTEFDLVCERSAVAALASSTFHIGGVVGMFISGPIADYYGRKIIIVFFLGLISVSGMLCSAVTELWQLMLLRAFIGKC